MSYGTEISYLKKIAEPTQKIMEKLLGYMARHHEDLEKTFTDEQKEIFEKFHVAKSETIEYRFGRVKPPKATIRQS